MSHIYDESYYKIIYEDDEEHESSSCKCFAKLFYFINKIKFKNI